MSDTHGTRRALLVDAFAKEPLAGSTVGVVPDAAALSGDQLRAIATELGAATTAFVDAGDEANTRLRVVAADDPRDGESSTSRNRCDEAIVAASAHLFEEGAVEADSATVDVAGAAATGGSSVGSDTTVVDHVDVEVESGGTVWVDHPTADVRTVEVDYDRLGAALGVDPASMRDVGADLPAAIAATRDPFLLVPVNFLSALGGCAPDPDAITTICEKHDVAGVYAFTFDTLSAEATLHARAFVSRSSRPGSDARASPLDSGTPALEPPASPTAAGACGAYLHGTDAFDDPPEEVVVEQGHFRDRPSQIRVRPGGGRDPLRVGGRAVTSLDGRLVVPDADDEEIVEA